MLSRYRGELYRANAEKALVDFVESDGLHALDYEETLRFYSVVGETGTDADMAFLGAVDRFFLFTVILGRVDGFHPWLFERCREVELEPDGFLDLWAREHYKSTLITYCGSIQEILNDPEITIGVFSHTKDISSAFVSQVKREFEANATVRKLYPEICWLKPTGEAPTWSTLAFTVRRQTNPKEATMEAHGLVDGQPTSRHFGLLVYDDVVTLASVSNPVQVKKTTEAWEMSDNLGDKQGRKWHIGTRYAFGDTYGDILQRGILEARIYAATHDGRPEGRPVFLSPEAWSRKKRTQRSTLAAQMLQNPLAGKERVFDPKSFRPYEIRPTTLNVYIMVDPSRGRSATSDRTAMAVVGIDTAGNKYLLDGFCHRMSLSERWDHLKHLHMKWTKQPGVGLLKVGYERYGQQSDDEYFQERMQREKYHFAMIELNWTRDGTVSKAHRVERLQPDFDYGSFYLPGLVHVAGIGTAKWSVADDALAYAKSEGDSRIVQAMKARGQEYLVAKPLKRLNGDKEVYDVTRELIDEMMFFPFAHHDDFVDAVSRIYDMDPIAASVTEQYEEDEDELVAPD
jgi:hypothetical protein